MKEQLCWYLCDEKEGICAWRAINHSTLMPKKAEITDEEFLPDLDWCSPAKWSDQGLPPEQTLEKIVKEQKLCQGFYTPCEGKISLRIF